ncbi:MAG: PAS domain-containing sensor histidine kinase [Terriglobales bacterium]
MRLSRAFAAAAIGIVALHVWVLAQLGTSHDGVLWSNGLQLTDSLLAAAAFGVAARRSHGFVRDTCALTALSFVLWSIAQTGWLYHEAFERTAVRAESWVNVLFFFAFAPLIAAVFLPLRPRNQQEVWPLALDTLQLGIALVSAYLFFFYTPSFLPAQPGMSDVAMPRVTEARNWLIFLALLAASVGAMRREARGLLGRLAAVFFIYSLGETIYFHFSPVQVINTGKWFDLTWTLSFSTAAVLAGGVGNGPEKASAQDEPVVKPSWTFYTMPAFLPLVTWLMALHVGRDQFYFAATVVSLSFLCYTARLYITHINLQRAIQAVRDSENKFALAFKQSFSPVVISSLSEGRFLEVNDAFVAFYGAPREEVIGKTAMELGLWVNLEQRERAMQEIRAKGRIRDCEAWLRNRAGEIRTVLFYGDVLNLPGEPWMLVTANDVTESRRAERERVKLLGDLISAEEEERRRIARELHDGTGQALTSLLLQLRALQQARSLDKVHSDLDLLRKSVSDAVDDLRRISRGLHPTVLDDFGLVPALRRLAEDAAATGRLRVDFSADGLEQYRLARTVEVAVYRTVQEALHNVVKHAAAAAVQVSLQRTDGELRIVVRDNGTGFEVDEALRRASEENRLGLVGIRPEAGTSGRAGRH